MGKQFLDERTDWQSSRRRSRSGRRTPSAAARRSRARGRSSRRSPTSTRSSSPTSRSNVRLIAPALAVEDVVTQTCEPAEVEKIRKTTGRTDLAPVQLLGANGWNDPSLFDMAPGGPGRHVRCAVLVDGFFAARRAPRPSASSRRTGKKYAGQTPTILEASAHDAARMARQLVETRVQTRAALRDGLARLKGLPRRDRATSRWVPAGPPRRSSSSSRSIGRGSGR